MSTEDVSASLASASSSAARDAAQTAIRGNRKKTPWVGIWSTVGIGFIVIYCLAPFYWMVVSSLRPDDEIFENTWWPRHPTFDNYGAVFSSGNHFGRGLINSLIVSVVVTVVALVVATFASYALARLDFRGKSALLLVVLATSMFPLVAIIVPLLKNFSDWGWTNTYQAMIINSNMQPATVMLSKFTGDSQFNTPFGSQMAAGVIMTLPLVIMVLLFQRRIVAGLAAGGIKQ